MPRAAAAEGATLGLFSYDALKSKKTPRVAVDLLTNGDDSSSSLAWSLGTTVSHAQNLARTLMETPANLMTPRLFCDRAESELANVQGRIEWMIHDAEWAERMGMNAFLSVTRGSAEPPRFLEVHYRGKDAATAPTMMDLALVGKGVTFDSGGISIKPSAGMALMRGDMGGAAVTFASIVGSSGVSTQECHDVHYSRHVPHPCSPPLPSWQSRNSGSR